MQENELRARLAVVAMPGIGRATFRALLAQAGSMQGVLAAGQGAWRGWGLTPEQQQALSSPDWALADRQLAWQQAGEHHYVLTLGDAAFPTQLVDLPDAPVLLWVRGNLSCLGAPQVAVVGSRNATSGGLRIARDFAHDLAAAGLCVTSGLASGIDAAAHEGALSAAAASTLAVVGTGVDLVYPARNKALAEQMLAQGGAIVSEFALGTRAEPWHFPARNRIISGLSLGTLVVEAAEGSGSLITAQQALEQGREVFAIPGSIHNPLVKGCHALIRRGQAKLTETVADVLAELAPQLRSFVQMASAQEVAAVASPEEAGLVGEPAGVSQAALALWHQLPYDPVLADVVMQHSGLDAGSFAALLLELEMSDSVILYSGNRIARQRQ